ncbi:hypothetical protein K504DRAFT_286627 [Pleomassaria siparia CBS 279.74]|uniref:Uncharacterized protein n=1 Tax=Pleomassaria siparia CBS 279.74 TaxID=1314801 RepID=A0A6G1K6Z6_9PLEO|nr:hypothetical protein K504DRAFT_286627 [Pleomassaria siparia CBS 279.74]
MYIDNLSVWWYVCTILLRGGGVLLLFVQVSEPCLVSGLGCWWLLYCVCVCVCVWKCITNCTYL